jgi:hypothetical protein
MTLVAYRAARDRLEPESAPGSKLMTLLAYRRLKEGVVRSPAPALSVFDDVGGISGLRERRATAK